MTIGYSLNGDMGKTATAGTHIQFLIPPDKQGKTQVLGINYVNPSAVAHVLTFARSIGRTTCVGVNAAGQAVVNILASPATVVADVLVANDFVAIRESDGITRLYQVSSVSVLAITLTANLVTGTLGGESFWMFGALADTDPHTGLAHPSYSLAATLTLAPALSVAALLGTFAQDEPILFDSSNGTTAGTLQLLNWGYSVN